MDDFRDGLNDASEVTGAASKLSKNLPGMVNTSNGAKEDAPEPKICNTCNQPIVICPTCHQKVVDSQPSGDAFDKLNKGIESADKAVGCCNNLFDCFGKAQEMTGAE